jgi:hypothetical protein
VPARYRKQLLRQHDFVLLAIVELCRAEPDWSAGKVSASLQGTCPGLNERMVAELRKVIGAKHAKRRGGALEARGPMRERLRIGACGFILGAWYQGREPSVPVRQFVGVALDDRGQFVVMYRTAESPMIYRTSFQSWRKWQRGRDPAAGCRTVPDNGLNVQVQHSAAVECEAA